MTYNPTKSGFLDTMESNLDKLSGQSPISRSAAKVLAKFDLQNTTIYAHSQGGLIARNAVLMRVSAGQAVSGLRVAFDGAAVNELSTRTAFSMFNISTIRFAAHSVDAVPNIVGYNALTYFNPLRIVGSFLSAPLLVKGGQWSPHTYPGGGSKIWWIPDFY